VSEPWLPWVVLQPSRLQRRLVALALVASTMTFVSLIAAAMQAPTATRVAAGALAAAAALAAFAGWRRSARQRTGLRIEADGQIAVRQGDGTATAEPVFVSPWLICLRTAPQRLVPVWRDGLDASGYRRLAAAARWRTRRKSEPDRIPDGIV
jgi:hypothetical protein